ncbi:MAG TPA: triose-phosphate isomerase [Magnetospirillaceae bacterium]|jgi:triosephosphate isomerase
MSTRKLIVGNWKMNGRKADALALVNDLLSRLSQATPHCDLMVCPPAVHVDAVAAATASSKLGVGGQDCHAAASGAHTGDIAAPMLKDLGCVTVIVGHSERRTNHGETDAQVKAKAIAARAAGLLPIVAIGETLAQRDGGQTLSVVAGQLRGSLPDGSDASNTVVAYEPVWAIGTGRTATVEQVAEVHAAIQKEAVAIMGADKAKGLRILYGGSVTPANAQALLALADVGGALVGGASLKGDQFWAIAEACPR